MYIYTMNLKDSKKPVAMIEVAIGGEDDSYFDDVKAVYKSLMTLIETFQQITSMQIVVESNITPTLE
jgi:hypothetical protein